MSTDHPSRSDEGSPDGERADSFSPSTNADLAETVDPGDKQPSAPAPGLDPRLGPYEILAEIGRGGMGVVYKAFHLNLKRTVALKVLIAGEDASDESISRFHREAEAVAKLGHHPNIVPVYDIGRQGNLHYFAMHFVDGKPLDGLIDDGEVAPRRAAAIARTVAEALQHAHDHGVHHRDVKPGNILVSKEGEVQITDFGLAKDVESGSKMTRSGVTLGTPHYMPPEQADGRLDDIDARSDVYSLGATLYEMLAYQPPFEGATVIEVVQKVILADPVPVRKRNAGVDKDLETICMKCLEKNPDRRYATARELADDLGRYLEGEAIVARPVSSWEHLAKRMRRNKAVSIALFALAFVLLGGGAAGLVGWIQWGAVRDELQKGREDARKAKEEAEKKAEKARTILRKGRAVSAVLRLANIELGDARKELFEAFMSGAKPEEARATGERLWPKVDAYEKAIPGDGASRATWLALKGWLRWLGGNEDKARSLFEESRRADGDVAYGILFEAMAGFTRDLALRPWPRPAQRRGRVVLDGEDGPPASRGQFGDFDGTLAEASKAEVWGEISAEDFQEAVEGIIAFRKGDGKKAEQGLGKALRLPELIWLKEVVLLARAGVYYSGGRFRDALKDVDEILRLQPRHRMARGLRGEILYAAGLGEGLDGKDPRETFREAVRTLLAFVEQPDPGPAYPIERGRFTLALANCRLGAEEAGRGGDGRRFHLEAIGQLRIVIGSGYRDSGTIRTDPDLAPLRDLPEFKALLEGD